MIYAHKTHAPPTALILSSACLLKNLAFTITGCFGRRPFPRKCNILQEYKYCTVLFSPPVANHHMRKYNINI
ncbi:hypothetical protein ALC53_13280 [Atta colombica]|uniref:Uncharacterized protein n=1 Tax=Atta colombica TaxID=520822 RepID=A0A195AVJ3_9HYME|nr:hypothetical protein ALC53_13280 [Atta colombica]